jgi:hypothetical protein
MGVCVEGHAKFMVAFNGVRAKSFSYCGGAHSDHY